MIRRIFLHGYLADLHDGVIELEADSVAEAIGGLNQFQALHEGAPHMVRIEGVDSQIALFSLSDDIADIHVYPRDVDLSGAGGKFGQILLGIALVAVAIQFPNIAAFGVALAPQIFLAGAMMVLGGILQLLVPVPNANDSSQKSRYLGASANTTTIGTRIAYIYGTRKHGGQYLSFDVDAVDIAGAAGAPAADPSTNYYEHDVLSLGTLPRAPVNAVYAASVAASGVFPVSSWVG